MQALAGEWERCPDGTEIIDLGPEEGRAYILTPFGRAFQYRSDRRVPFQIEAVNLENPIVVRLINARDETELTEFFGRFGLLTSPHLDVDGANDWRESLRRLLTLATSEDRAGALKALNQAVVDHKVTRVQPVLDLSGEGGSVRMIMKAPTLASFMVLECLSAAINQASFAECEHCRDVFLTGPMTGRRSHAVYCSDRCRVAAMRVRNKAK